MGTLEIAGLALALGADCLSVCIGLGMERSGSSRLLRLSALLGIVQSSLFLLGYQAAAAFHALLHISGVLERILGSWFETLGPSLVHDRVHVALSVGGAAVLAVLGANMIASSIESLPSVDVRVRRGRIGLLLIAVMVNVDSVTAGFGLGMLDGIDLPAVAGLMAIVGGTMAWIGLSAGQTIGRRAGRFAQPIGGAILLAIAARVLLVDIWG